MNKPPIQQQICQNQANHIRKEKKNPSNCNQVKVYKTVESFICLSTKTEYNTCSGVVDIPSVTLLDRTDFLSSKKYMKYSVNLYSCYWFFIHPSTHPSIHPFINFEISILNLDLLFIVSL